MSSTRRTTARLLAALSAAPLLSGCLKHTEPPAAVSRAPLVIDEAMERRQWRTVAVHFQNGETPAWPTGFVLAHRPDAPKWAPVVTDTALFLANVVAMPIGYAVTPGWTSVIYANDVVPPSYNAMPPLPPPK
jgi:hypothetical protein